MGYAQDRDFEPALTNFQQALELYKKIKNSLKQAHSLYFIGKMYLKLNNYEIANQNYNKALNIAQNIKNQELKADILFDLGSVAAKSLNYNKSLNFYRQTLKIYKKIDNIVEQGETLFEIGKLFREKGEEHYQEALKNFKHALKIMVRERKLKNEIESRIQIGDLLILTDQPQEALDYYQKAIKKSKTSNNILEEVEAYFGKGKALFELQKYKDAIRLFQLAYDFYQKIKYLKGEVASLTYLSNSYEKLGEAELAKKFKKLAQEKSKKLEKKNNA